MDSKVTDITPLHSPISLFRDMEQRVINTDAIAACAIYLDKNDTLHYDNCGLTRKDLLWALKLMEKRLMETDD